MLLKDSKFGGDSVMVLGELRVATHRKTILELSLTVFQTHRFSLMKTELLNVPWLEFVFHVTEAPVADFQKSHA